MFVMYLGVERSQEKRAGPSHRFNKIKKKLVWTSVGVVIWRRGGVRSL